MDRIRPTDTTEEKIENLTDPEASAIFREAFYAEAKALEKEALAHPVEVDEERKEALRRRILQSVAAEVEDTDALKKEPECIPEKIEAAKTPMPEDTSPAEIPERKYSVEASEEIAPEGMSEKKSATGTSKKVLLMETSEIADLEESSEKTHPKETKRKNRRLSPLVRWAAVLVLACVGVLGVSMTSQAKGNGLWSSIQRLIGVEIRWEQEDNGEDRSISDPEEYKAIFEIEEKLGIRIPIFFYWPGKMVFSEADIFDEANKFIITYVDEERVIYFEGWKGDANSSANNAWQGEGKTEQLKNDGTVYTIAEADSDVYEKFYYVKWTVGDNSFSLSGVFDQEELKKILKNIKN